MSKTLTLQGEIRPDYTLTVTLPDDMPIGPAQILVTAEMEEPTAIRTLGELANSEFFAMFADRDDLPTTNEDFREWRRKLWEPPHIDPSGH